MKHTFSIAIILLLLTFATGCATSITRCPLLAGYGLYNTPIVFPATRMDIMILGYSFSKEGEEIPAWEFWTTIPVVLVDTPFSIIFDTILLPFDLGRLL